MFDQQATTEKPKEPVPERWQRLCGKKFRKLIGPLRQRAREFGYALAVHGSLKRDIDLIAVPWSASAAPERILAEALLAVAVEVNGAAWLSWHPSLGAEYTKNGAPGLMPHGRLGWVINLGGGPYIDLAVMPRKM